MPSKNALDLIFPVGGVNRTMAYQNQPPYSAVDCLNVLPFDSEEGRARGGSRPGTRKAYFNDLGGAVRMLAGYDFLYTSLHRIFDDSFDSSALGSNWSAIGSTTIMPLSHEYAVLTAQQTGAAALDSLSMLISSTYTVGMYIAPYRHAFHGIYRLYLRMNNTTPAPTTSGVIVEVSLMGDSLTATLLSYTGAVETVVDTYIGSLSIPQSYADGSWLRAKVVTDVVTVYWGETEILSGTVDTHNSSNQRVGFGATCLDPSGRCLIEQFRVEYISSDVTFSMPVKTFVAASSGVPWWDSPADGLLYTMASLAPTRTLASDKDLCAVQYGQKLYIADHSEVIASGTNGVDGGSTTTFDSASYADWTANTTIGAGFTTAVAGDYVLVITNATSDLIDGAYEPTVVASGALTTSPANNTGTAGTCTFSISRCPKILDLQGTLTRWVATTGKGQVPTGSKVIARYRERAVLAVGIQWFMSRQGDWLDWHYGGTIGDAKRAISGSVSDAGVPGDNITALASSNDDYLLVFCTTSTWIIIGDPAYTGQIKNVSETIGCIGPKAWCHGPDSAVYFLSRGGLAVMGMGYATPQLLSATKIPRELLNVNAALYTVSLAYDLAENRVYIFITDPNSNRSGRHWCYDVRTDSFWPLFFPAASQPTSAMWYTSELPDDSCVIMGCRDGYLRRFDRYCDTDDGNSFNSYVVYGPIQLGSGYTQGRIDEMIADVGLDSRDVSWELRVGDNPEASFYATARETGTWTEGMNHKVRPRVRGGGFCIKVGRFASQTAGWAMERITVLRAALGKRR